MHHAGKNSLLNGESFRSNPGKMAATGLIQKTREIDQMRMERRTGGIFYCDASGCYDRILPPLASVHLQALGIHQSIGTFLARLMFQKKRLLRKDTLTYVGISRNKLKNLKQNWKL